MKCPEGHAYALFLSVNETVTLKAAKLSLCLPAIPIHVSDKLGEAGKL